MKLSLREAKVIALTLDYALYQIDSSHVDVLETTKKRSSQMDELARLLLKIRKEYDMDYDLDFGYRLAGLEELLLK